MTLRSDRGYQIRMLTSRGVLGDVGEPGPYTVNLVPTSGGSDLASTDSEPFHLRVLR
jgi:hypothetical protein